MKRTAIAAVLLILLLSGCFFLSRGLQSATDRLSREASAIETAVREKGGDRIGRSIESFLQSWERDRPFFVALCGRTNCEPIDTVLAAIPIWYEVEDTGELLAALSQLSSHVSELWELQAPRLTNLF